MDTEAGQFPLRCNEKVFRSIAATVVPEAGTLGVDDWAEFYSLVEHALSMRPPAIVKQLSAFVTLINLLALARHARSFVYLTSGQRYTLLHSLETSRLGTLRKGMWGLRTLMLMGFYARPAGRAAIGYRADARGWAALRTQGTAQ
ncbi:MAG: hypothetical protein WEE89_00915 [Gemmatimonadota bacterium]